jgi:putative ABC transport system ATP-binding protein
MTMEGPEILRVTGLTKVFGEGERAVRAVDGVDLTVCCGELVLIMGPSGSGKTTLLMMIGGLLRPTSGSIAIEGAEITSMSDAELVPIRRKSVGFVFQSFNLWESLTVQENVELPLNIAGVKGHAARDRARAALIERGLGRRLSFRSRDLSGGEKQRVSIARALANEPKLLLADEPTANLDSKHGRDVMHLLQRIAKEGDRAVIVVSHDHRVREVADRVLWLEDGSFKDMGRLATDPVCGMTVEVDEAKASLQHNDRTYYFCSRGCSWEFQEDPEVFLRKGVSSSRVRQHLDPETPTNAPV